MTAFRIPGVLGAYPQCGSLEDGTLARVLSPVPGPLCGYSRAYVGDTAPVLFDATKDAVIASLFTACRAPAFGLAETDFEEAATTLSVDVSAIKAVAEVETRFGPFDDYGRPTILFERHKFHQYTGGRFARQHPRVSNAWRGGYGKYSAQYDKLEEA